MPDFNDFVGRYNDAPSNSLIAITPSDTTVFSPMLRGLYVGVGGNVAFMAANDSVAVTLLNVPAGVIIPIICKSVMATNTTATSLVGLR